MSARNRIEARLAALRADRRKGLIPFITCGDPSPQASVAIMHALVAAGADLIELGVPFSDPQADGPVIQRASERALARKVGLRAVLDCCRAFRADDRNTPLVLMGYLNPIEIYGLERFAADAAAAGVDGALLVDCPPEEAAPVRVALSAAGVQMLALAAPTSSLARVQQLAADAQGYLYYVAFAGVTGANRLDAAAVAARVEQIRALTELPIAVGFGIKDAASAAAAAVAADAVVIGSALVEALAAAGSDAEAATRAGDFLRPIRRALDGKG